MIEDIEHCLRRPQLTDRDWVQHAFMGSGREGADFCFGCIYMWAPVYDYKIANVDGMFVGRSRYSYTLPAGDGDASVILEELLKQSTEPLRLSAICEYQKTWLEERFPGTFRFTEDRDNEDYLYRVEALANLSGKKYHGKRNHCSFFEKNNNWTYEEMTQNVAEECMQFSHLWVKENERQAKLGADQELDAIQRALAHFDELGFVGGVLRIDGTIVANTCGEPINDYVFDTHVEKADASIRGAYPMITREFARNSIAQYTLVNREEDMGIDGLRQAKLSWHPEQLLTKYIAEEIR